MEEIDEEMLREMLAWLSRGMESDGNILAGDGDAPLEMELTEEDYAFLHEHGIAIPE